MTTSESKTKSGTQVNSFLKDLRLLCSVPTSKKHRHLLLEEYPFDNQLLCLSRMYRESRKLYLSLGGAFNASLCSTMRSLSAQDLFKDEISYTPSATEFLWFKDHQEDVADPAEEMESLIRYSGISLYHEQNHRVVWRVLPPAPSEERDLCRYLNFAESLVVVLDLALGDELGRKLSPVFERLKVIYRPGGENKWHGESKKVYRQYLLALLCTTYYALELINYDDILKAVDYVLPGQKALNKQAVRRGLELSEHFTRITNPLWQERHWKVAQKKLGKMHEGSNEAALYLPEDPLELEAEFFFAHRLFDLYGL